MACDYFSKYHNKNALLEAIRCLPYKQDYFSASQNTKLEQIELHFCLLNYKEPLDYSQCFQRPQNNIFLLTYFTTKCPELGNRGEKNKEKVISIYTGLVLL